jgi:hypothetical protein
LFQKIILFFQDDDDDDFDDDDEKSDCVFDASAILVVSIFPHARPGTTRRKRAIRIRYHLLEVSEEYPLYVEAVVWQEDARQREPSRVFLRSGIVNMDCIKQLSIQFVFFRSKPVSKKEQHVKCKEKNLRWK